MTPRSTFATLLLLFAIHSTCFATSLSSLSSDGGLKNGTFVSPTLTSSSTSDRSSSTSIRTSVLETSVETASSSFSTGTFSSSSARSISSNVNIADESSSSIISSTTSQDPSSVWGSSVDSITSGSGHHPWPSSFINSTSNSDNRHDLSSPSANSISNSSNNAANYSATATNTLTGTLISSSSFRPANTSTERRANTTTNYANETFTFPWNQTQTQDPQDNNVPGYIGSVFMDITYTGGPFPTSCPQAERAGNKTTKSPWLAPWIIGKYTFANDNPCQYHWCRAQLYSKYPYEDSDHILSNFSRSTSGCFYKQTMVRKKSTLEGGEVTSLFSDVLSTQCNTTTLHGWGNRWGGFWETPCCDSCHVFAGTIDIRYWPPSSPGQPDPLIITENGGTYVSPSIYATFNTVVARDFCSIVGKDRVWPVVSFAPEDISEILPNINATNAWAGESGYDHVTMDWSSYHSYYSENCLNRSLTVYNTRYNVEHGAYDWCFPRVGLPSGWAAQIDPKWSTCISEEAFRGFLDPPFALTPYPWLIVPDTDEESTSPPEVSATTTQSYTSHTEPPAPGTRLLPPVQEPSFSPPPSPTPSDDGDAPMIGDPPPGQDDWDYSQPTPPESQSQYNQASSPPQAPVLPQQSVIMTSIWSELAPVFQDDGNVVIDGQTLTPGQGSIMVSGTTMIMGTDGALYAGNTLLGSFAAPTNAPVVGQAGIFGDSSEGNTPGDGAQNAEGGSSGGGQVEQSSMRIGDFVMSAFGGEVPAQSSSVADTVSSGSTGPEEPSSPADGVSDTAETRSSSEGIVSSEEGTLSFTEGSSSSTRRNLSPSGGDGESTEAPLATGSSSGAMMVPMTNMWRFVCMVAIYATL